MDRRFVWGIVGVGALAAGVGAVIYIQRKKQDTRLLGRSKPKRPREVVTKKGMTLKHYRSSMPIRERVGILQDLTEKSVKDPNMRKLALQITHECPERDGLCEAKSIYDWMRRNIRYTGDIGPHKLGRNGPVEGIDLFPTASRVVEFGGDDCDGHAILACTLAIQNGMTCKYRVTSPSRRGEEWSHIYAMVGLPKNNPSKFVPLDTTLENGRFGSEASFGKALDFIA